MPSTPAMPGERSAGARAKDFDERAREDRALVSRQSRLGGAGDAGPLWRRAPRPRDVVSTAHDLAHDQSSGSGPPGSARRSHARTVGRTAWCVTCRGRESIDLDASGRRAAAIERPPRPLWSSTPRPITAVDQAESEPAAALPSTAMRPLPWPRLAHVWASRWSISRPTMSSTAQRHERLCRGRSGQPALGLRRQQGGRRTRRPRGAARPMSSCARPGSTRPAGRISCARCCARARARRDPARRRRPVRLAHGGIRDRARHRRAQPAAARRHRRLRHLPFLRRSARTSWYGFAQGDLQAARRTGPASSCGDPDQRLSHAGAPAGQFGAGREQVPAALWRQARGPGGTAWPSAWRRSRRRRGQGHEGDHPGGGCRHAALSRDLRGQQAAAADLRQADDLLSAVDADAGGHPRDPGHHHAQGHRPLSRAAGRRQPVGASPSPMPSSRGPRVSPRPSSSAAASSPDRPPPWCWATICSSATA